MQTGRIIHTTINGRDQILESANVHQLLNDKNYEAVANLFQSEMNKLPEDHALTYTFVTPDFEESTGRSFYKVDTVICRFTPEELISYLKREEVERLLNRVEQKNTLFNRMGQSLQKNGEELTNPLSEPEV